MLKPSLQAGIVSLYHFDTYLHAKTQELEFISVISGLDLDEELFD